MKVVFRRATEADLRGLWALDRRCFVRGENFTQAYFRDLLANAKAVWVVSIGKIKFAGSYIVTKRWSTNETYLANLAVTPRCRGMGLGRMMLKRLIGRHKKPIWLHVRTGNPAIKLYKSAGFVVTSTNKQHYANGDGAHNMVLR